ncbi:tetratricopeptide repeat protein [Fimbriiglobus ruber]|uniref:TPR repeat protein n=1 Tax=Fimbriiglobus ruber TaxID=1908690 RepID=A0A225DHH5_9BACT|nr:tetratricopeptide repeat protein [Fimbriiglobus ruber]OWK40453.1 TPR repeat protein [Fimbriiglobus ruber]
MTARTRLLVGVVAVVLLAAGGWWAFRPGPSLPPPGPDQHLDDARRALAAGDYESAVEAARADLTARPGNPPTLLVLSQIFRRQGRLKDAEAALGRAVAAGVPEAEGRREAALLLAAQDYPPKAEGIIQRVVRDCPDDPEVLRAVSRAYFAKSRWLDAEILFTRLLVLDPNQPDILFERGTARMRAMYYGTAVEDFRAVLAKNPDNFQARLYLAQSLLGDARMAEAEPELKTCQRMRPELAEPVVGLAKCAVERDDLAGAEELLRRAAGLEKDSLLVVQEQAALSLRRQQYDAAIPLLKKVLAADPNNRQAHLNLAQALRSVGKLDESKVHEQRYQELDKLEEERLAAKRGMR